jgi:hypothetical protein
VKFKKCKEIAKKWCNRILPSIFCLAFVIYAVFLLMNQPLEGTIDPGEDNFESQPKGLYEFAYVGSGGACTA